MASIEQTFFSGINIIELPIAKGDQVFTTYGKRTNEFLLKNYGFCIV